VHASEYDRSSVDAAEVRHDHAVAVRLHATAVALLPSLGVLPRGSPQ